MDAAGRTLDMSFSNWKLDEELLWITEKVPDRKHPHESSTYRDIAEDSARVNGSDTLLDRGEGGKPDSEWKEWYWAYKTLESYIDENKDSWR